MPSSRQPLFVVLEGLDASGTTTQAQLLADALRRRDLRVCLTAEPSDGPLAKVLRAHLAVEIDLDPTTAALTFTADRADHLARVIRPALARGEWVVCDRYLLSTLAYQGAEGCERNWILGASRDFDTPGYTFFLDIPDAERLGRLGTRPTSERYDAPELSESLRASYTESIAILRGAGHRIEIVDGSATPEAVHAAILARLDALD
jgi:dTMP kinase